MILEVCFFVFAMIKAVFLCNDLVANDERMTKTRQITLDTSVKTIKRIMATIAHRERSAVFFTLMIIKTTKSVATIPRIRLRGTQIFQLLVNGVRDPMEDGCMYLFYPNLRKE